MIRRHQNRPTLLLLLGIVAGIGVRAQAEPPPRSNEIGAEHQVKAAFLMGIPKFVTWPSDASVERGDSLRIGVIYSKPLLQALRSMPNKEVKGKIVTVVEMHEFRAGLDVDILFVGRDARGAYDNDADLQAAMSALSEAPVLIVCEDEDFLNLGGIVNFYLDRGKVRFEIRNAAAEDHRLVLGAGLLRVARLVD